MVDAVGDEFGELSEAPDVGRVPLHHLLGLACHGPHSAPAGAERPLRVPRTGRIWVVRRCTPSATPTHPRPLLSRTSSRTGTRRWSWGVPAIPARSLSIISSPAARKSGSTELSGGAE